MSLHAFPWYETEDDFETVYSMLPFKDALLKRAYPDYCAHIESLEQSFIKLGAFPHRITIKPVALKAWCDAGGGTLNRDAIRRYALCKAKELIERGRSN